MDKKQEKMLAQAADARLVSLNDNVIFPLLDRSINNAIEQLCHEFKLKGHADLSKIAYITACKDLAFELEAIARHGNKAHAELIKLHKER